MKFNTVSSPDSGPSSSIGIMRFFDTESGGPKISPEFVIGVAVVMILVVGVFHVFT